VPYLRASAVVIHYEEALYEVYAPLPYLIFYQKGYVFGQLTTNFDEFRGRDV